MIFHAFVRPIIRQLSGEVVREDLNSEGLAATLSRNVASAPGREDLVRVALSASEGGRVAHPLMGNSAMISTMTKADGLHHDSVRSGRVARGRASARASLLSRARGVSVFFSSNQV